MLFGRDYFLSNMDLDSALWSMGKAAKATFVASLITAFVASVLRDISRRAPALLRALVSLLIVALFAACIAGIGFEPAANIPEIGTGNGFRGWLAIGTVAIFLALAQVFFSRKQRKPITGITLAIPTFALLGAFALLASFGAPRIQVREVVRSLLSKPTPWTVISEGKSGPVRAGVISPLKDWSGTTGERSTLVIPPGAEVSYEVTEEDGHVLFETAIAVNQHFGGKVSSSWEEVRFHFEVRVDGEVVSNEVLRWGKKGIDNDYGWRELGGRAGIALRPGNVVSLLTSVESVPPDPRAQLIRWRIGFSDPVLVRYSERERVASSPDNPNIVLVVMDTLRRDRIGCYGYEKDTTPNLDRLASRGTLYERAHSTSSWTWPSTTSILTGMTPERHGVIDNDSCHLARDYDVLAEALQRQNYTTAAFSGNPLISPSKQFDQGFETFFGGGGIFYKSRRFIPDAIEWMKANAGNRFFLYLHMVDPHHPHQPMKAARDLFVKTKPPKGYNAGTYPAQSFALLGGKAIVRGGGWDTTRVVPQAEQERLSNIYDACVATGDYWFGEVLNALDEFGLEDETIVAFTSDHGEEFFDHGMMTHGHSIFRELVDVPLVLAGPGIPGGVRSDALVSNRHLGTTLAQLGGSAIRGVESTIDLARPIDLVAQPIGYSTEQGWWNTWHRTPIWGLRDGRWNLHLAPVAGAFGGSTPTKGGEFRLFDMESDPKQLRNLADEQPERVAAMIERLNERVQAETALRTSLSIGAGEETIEMLQGIGYIEDEED